LRKQLVQLQNELQDAVERQEVAVCNETLAVKESSEQSQLAAEVHLYAYNEVTGHDSLVVGYTSTCTYAISAYHQ
jgi:hypothetical protein